MLVVFTGKDSK
jgi:magnesium-transporting ATPase (P-type)